MVDAVHFSSKDTRWGTPWDLFGMINREFQFGLDAAAEPWSAKLDNYITKEQNALRCNWYRLSQGRDIFVNPPYQRKRKGIPYIDQWLAKAWFESTKGCRVVCLIPARTATNWWHHYVAPNAHEIRLLIGRVPFIRPPGVVGDKNNAVFPSALVVFNGLISYTSGTPSTMYWDWRTQLAEEAYML